MKKYVALIVIGLAALIFTQTLGIIWNIQLDRACTGRLKRAADANNVELAAQELQVAVKYIQQNHLVAGSTHVLWYTPDCDLGYWSKNLQASLKELQELPKDASHLTVSNQLMKLRETLLDGGESGMHVTVPPWLSRYPSQRPMYWVTVAGLATVATGAIGIFN